MSSQQSINMVKVLSFTFQHFFGSLTMLLVKGFSETRLFRHLSDHVSSKLHELGGSSFFWKCSKLNFNLENGKKNWENIFHFWNKCIWKFCNKLSLLGREYLPPTINALTKSPKILYISKRDLSDWSEFSEINKYGNGAVVQLWTVF